jgi:hypothetical protein
MKPSAPRSRCLVVGSRVCQNRDYDSNLNSCVTQTSGLGLANSLALFGDHTFAAVPNEFEALALMAHDGIPPEQRDGTFVAHR